MITFDKILTVQRPLGGNKRAAAPHGANTHADSFLPPAGSILLQANSERLTTAPSFYSPRALLKRDDLLHSVRDCLAVVGAALFLAVTGIALAASVFMTFFCEF